MAIQRVGLFGGSFDPVHNGHLITARAAAEELSLDKVILLPTAHPPHKGADGLTPAEHRAAMIRLATADEELFDFDDYDLARPGPTYTVDTVRHFVEEFGPTVSLYWIIGADSLADLPTWSRVSELVELCTVVTTARPGWDASDRSALRAVISDEQVRTLSQNVLTTPCIEIMATDVRDRVRNGRSVRYLVPDAVADYIRSHGLYRTPAALPD